MNQVIKMLKTSKLKHEDSIKSYAEREAALLSEAEQVRKDRKDAESKLADIQRSIDLLEREDAPQSIAAE